MTFNLTITKNWIIDRGYIPNTLPFGESQYLFRPPHDHDVKDSRRAYFMESVEAKGQAIVHQMAQTMSLLENALQIQPGTPILNDNQY